jgi:hypothetical protein
MCTHDYGVSRCSRKLRRSSNLLQSWALCLGEVVDVAALQSRWKSREFSISDAELEETPYQRKHVSVLHAAVVLDRIEEHQS